MCLSLVHLGYSWPIGKMYEIGNVAKTAVSLARAFVIEFLYIDIEKETKVNELFKGMFEVGQSRFSLDKMEIFRLFMCDSVEGVWPRMACLLSVRTSVVLCQKLREKVSK